MRKILFFGLIILMSYNLPVEAQTAPQKKGILLITFGTSYPEAQKAFDHVDTLVKRQWPGTDVFWAYTSRFIRNKLRNRGIEIDSPAGALAKMCELGYTHVAVQSLHIIPGAEFHDVLQTVDAFTQIPKGVPEIKVGGPLLCSHRDMEQMAQIICNTFKTGNKEAVLLMGHGTHHGSNVYYPAFQYYLNKYSDHHFIGTVEGFPLLEDVMNELRKRNYRKVKLVPFMSVAGDHAQNDMAGQEPQSWKSQLEAAGYEVSVEMKGLAEMDEVVNIWLNHLNEVFDAL